jgi:hypothetical protein
LISIPVDQQADVGETLFFRLPISITDDKWAKPADAAAAWSALVDSIGFARIPVNSEGQRSIFTHIDKARSTGLGEPALLRKSPSEGPIWGLRLAEGSSCELVVHHRLPALLNQHTGPNQFQLVYVAHTHNLETDVASDLITSNYDRHALTVSGVHPTRETEQLTVHTDQAIAQDGTTIPSLDLPINLRITQSFFYRLRTTYVWLLGLFGALLLSSLSSLWTSNLSSASSTTTPTTAHVVQAIGGSALAAFFIFMIQQRFSSPRP